jgi:hypothetical protein
MEEGGGEGEDRMEQTGLWAEVRYIIEGRV